MLLLHCVECLYIFKAETPLPVACSNYFVGEIVLHFSLIVQGSDVLRFSFINFRCTVLKILVFMICTSKESLLCCTLRTVYITPYFLRLQLVIGNFLRFYEF